MIRWLLLKIIPLSLFQEVMEFAILKLHKTGRIDVTVRHVVPHVKCAACGGKGRVDGTFSMEEVRGFTEKQWRDFTLLMQGVCLACRGRGVID